MNYLRLSFLCLCLIVASAAPALAKSIDDCEKIQQADAYNQCLASFGPKRGERRAPSGAQQSEDEPPRYGKKRWRGKAMKSRSWSRHTPGRRGSRMRMEFSVSPR